MVSTITHAARPSPIVKAAPSSTGTALNAYLIRVKMPARLKKERLTFFGKPSRVFFAYSYRIADT
jgi:hypothetical protein